MDRMIIILVIFFLIQKKLRVVVFLDVATDIV